MALWMEQGSTPTTEKEQADLDAINALKESSALELKEKGNEYIKTGKEHYADAIDCYTRAINQKISNNVENSILFANRAHANLLLGNYRRALMDAEDAVKINPKNVKVVRNDIGAYTFMNLLKSSNVISSCLKQGKILMLAYYRGAKAAFALELLAEAGRFCRSGLEQFPANEKLKKLEENVNTKQAGIDNLKLQASEALSTAEACVSALHTRSLKLGKAMYKELTGVRKPRLDESGILHWPVLFLYGEVMSSDFIEDFCETDMFSIHLDMLFGKDAPQLPWDEKHAYSREAIELYYQANAGRALPKRKVLEYFLEDTAGTIAKTFEEETDDGDIGDDFASMSVKDSLLWVKVNERKTLQDVLKRHDHVIPGIPVFYAVSRLSSFYEEFVSGNWSSP